jgi:hypothetical protein
MPMRQKEWIKELGDDFRLRVRLATVFGRIVDFTVALVHGENCIARYDTAHGFPHLDWIGKENSLIKKESYEKLSIKEVFDHAIHDLSEHREKYLDYFERP